MKLSELIFNKIISFNKAIKTSIDSEVAKIWMLLLRDFKLEVYVENIKQLINDLRSIIPKFENDVRNYINFMKTNLKKIENLEKWCYYCILTRGVSIERTFLICRTLQEINFNTREELLYKLKVMGYRFSDEATNQILFVKKNINQIYDVVWSNKPGYVVRKELRKLIPGIGIKRASLILREVKEDVAPIDIHVFNFLKRYGIVFTRLKKPGTLITQNYIKIENLLREIANVLNISLGFLDLTLFLLDSNISLSSLIEQYRTLFS